MIAITGSLNQNSFELALLDGTSLTNDKLSKLFEVFEVFASKMSISNRILVMKTASLTCIPYDW